MGPDGAARAEKAEILTICADPPQLLPALKEHFIVHVVSDGGIPDVLPAAAKNARALVTGTLVGADKRLIDSLAKLEIVACTGGHIDRIDVAAIRARGIPLTNAPGISAPDVADLALAFILGVSRALDREPPLRSRRPLAGWRNGLWTPRRRQEGRHLWPWRHRAYRGAACPRL